MSQHRHKGGVQSGKNDNAAEKIRIMKEKQKQWMQEREFAKESGVKMSRPSSGNKQAGKTRKTPVSSTKNSGLTWISKDDYYSPVKKPGAKTTPRKNERLASRESGYGSSQTKDAATERSRVSRKSDTSVTGFDEGKQKSTRTPNIAPSDGTSPENFVSGSFNNLADKIAVRLQVQEKNRDGQNETLNKNDKPLSNHNCPGCRSLMSPPQHSPIAMIPCGHTFCQACVSDFSKCPQCQSEIFSTAPNTVMQQIIKDFAKRQEKERLKQLEEQTRKYVEEYQNLNLRCEGLADEADRILNSMEAITEGIIEEKRVSRKLEKENDDFKSKIKELELKFTENEELIKQTSLNCHGLEQDYNEEKEKLTLIEETIKTIRNSKERAKIMVQNLAPSLKLDDSF